MTFFQANEFTGRKYQLLLPIFAALVLSGCEHYGSNAEKYAKSEVLADIGDWPDNSLHATNQSSARLAMAEYTIIKFTQKEGINSRKICVNFEKSLHKTKAMAADEFDAFKRKYKFLAPLDECLQFQISNKIYVPRPNTVVIEVTGVNCYEDSCFADSKWRTRERNPGWSPYVMRFDKMWHVSNYQPALAGV